MKNHLQYKGYIGSVEISVEDDVFFGKLLGIRSLISYEGTSCSDLVYNFHEAVDDYLDSCAAEGLKPEIPYKGSFNVRIAPKLHEKVALYALHESRSLNSCVSEALERYIATREVVC